MVRLENKRHPHVIFLMITYYPPNDNIVSTISLVFQISDNNLNPTKEEMHVAFFCCYTKTVSVN